MKHSNGFLNFWKLIPDVLSAFKTPENINWFPKFLLSPGLCNFRIQGEIFLYLIDGLYIVSLYIRYHLSSSVL